MKQHIFKFNELNEASELTKYGVPPKMAKLIHSLSGGEKVTDPFILQSGKILNRKIGYKEFGVSHDIKLVKTITKTKSYDKDILDYLDSIQPDSNCSLLLVSPDKSYCHYIYYKSQSVQHATKGNQYRVITIDKSTGDIISKWAGTNGQLAGSAPIGTHLYVFENEKRSEEKREARKALHSYTDEQFLDYVIENFKSILDKAFGKAAKGAEKKFYEKLTGLTPEDIKNSLIKQKYGENVFPTAAIPYPGKKEAEEKGSSWNKLIDLLNLADMIDRDVIDKEQLVNELQNFKEYMMKHGSYEHEENPNNAAKKDKADLNDIIKTHTLMGAVTKFLQFVTFGKTLTATDDYNQFFI